MLEGGHHYSTRLTDLREMAWVGAGAIESQAPSPWAGCAVFLISPLASGACHLSSCFVVGGARCAHPTPHLSSPCWQWAMPSLPHVRLCRQRWLPGRGLCGHCEWHLSELASASQVLGH